MPVNNYLTTFPRLALNGIVTSKTKVRTVAIMYVEYDKIYDVRFPSL
jgi:hypothetical protein